MHFGGNAQPASLTRIQTQAIAELTPWEPRQLPQEPPDSPPNFAAHFSIASSSATRWLFLFVRRCSCSAGVRNLCHWMASPTQTTAVTFIEYLAESPNPSWDGSTHRRC